MDVDTNADRVLPSENVISIVNPNLPSLEQKMEIDGSIDHSKKMHIYPEPTDMGMNGPLEFIIHETPGYYVDLTSIVIDVKVKLYNAGGGRDDVANWKSYFINNLAQNLWSSIKVSLNNTVIESNYNNQQLSNLHHILTTPNILVKERGFVQGCFPITTSSIKNTIDDDHVEVDDIKKRIAYSKSNDIHLMAPLHLDLTSATKFLTDGVNIKITLEPSNAMFLIKRTDTAGVTKVDHKYKIEGIRLMVTKYKPVDGVLISETKKLLNKPFEYVMRRNIVKEVVFPQGHSELTISRPFQAIVPNKIYMFMIEQSGARGTYNKHPFNYGHNNLQSYSIKLNGLEIAGHETDDGLVETYLESLREHGEDYFISYDVYKKSCFVICADMNQGSNENTIAIERRGNLQISLRLNAPLPQSLLVYVVGVVDSTFEIDTNKSVTTHFQY